MARRRRLVQRQGLGGCPPAPLPGMASPGCWPGIPAPQEPLGSPPGTWPWQSLSHPATGSAPTRADLPFLSADGSQFLNNGSPGHGDIWRGINSFFLPFFLSLVITAAQGEAFPGLTPPKRHCPNPSGPVPLPGVGALRHRLPLPGRTEGLVPAAAETDREGRGGAALGGPHARTGKCCAAGSNVQPPKSRAGGSCCKMAARGVGGDRSLPAASREKDWAGTGAQGPEAEAYSPS